jgi:hypothetical protein
MNFSAANTSVKAKYKTYCRVSPNFNEYPPNTLLHQGRRSVPPTLYLAVFRGQSEPVRGPLVLDRDLVSGATPTCPYAGPFKTGRKAHAGVDGVYFPGASRRSTNRPAAPLRRHDSAAGGVLAG